MTKPPSFHLSVPVILGVALGWAATLLTAAAELSYRTHWLGHAGTEIPTQTSAHGLAVTADGTCIVSSTPGAGPPVLAFYRDGRLVGRAAAPAGGGHAFTGAVAVSEKSMVAAVALDPMAAGVSPTTGPESAPGALPGTRWHGLWRWTREGQPAPFAGGRGDDKAFLLIHETPAAPDPDSGVAPVLAGLWIHQGELFVSDAAAGRIRVYDEATMTEKRSFGADRPSGLCVLGSGLQVIERGEVVSAFTLDGRRTGQVLDEGDDLIPGAVAPTPEGRLLVSDLGASQQVHFFNMSGVPTRVRTLGDELGLYGPPTPGTAGPRRFAGLTGVGADAAGHLYVAMNPPPGGFVLRSFGTDRKTLHWHLAALALRHGADVDPGSDGQEIYTAEGRHTLDLSQPPGQSWRWVAQSVNPFRYPHDPRLLTRTAALEAPAKTAVSDPAPPTRPEPQGGTTTFRELDGHPLLVVRSPDGSMLGLYRLQNQTAVPALVIQTGDPSGIPVFQPPGRPERGPWVWRDGDGDGMSEPAEFSAAPAFRGRFASSPIDADGGFWLTTSDGGIAHWPRHQSDNHGVPIPTTPTTPASAGLPLRSPQEIHYEAARDTLYRATITPDSSEHAFTLEAFDGGSKGPAVSTRRWSQCVSGEQAVTAPPSLCVAGDLLFALHPATQCIHVFDAALGAPLGQLQPPTGPAARSGIAPSSALRAHRRRDGTYLVLVQDQAAPRVLAYHLDAPLKGVTGR